MKPALRISIGVAAMSVCLVFLADTVLGIFPDPVDPVLDARKQLCETLGIQFAALATEEDPERMRPAMQNVLRQHEEVLSMGLRDRFSEVVLKTAQHDEEWQGADEQKSTPTHIRIPIFRDDLHWATLEISFTPLPFLRVSDLLQSPLYKLALVMGFVGFFSYLIYLSRTLRYLDPSSVVPGRVRAALDQLVEGAMILDHDQRIVLANQSLADKVGRASDDLLGVNPADLDWLTEVSSTVTELPWLSVSRTGERAENVRLQLKSPTLGIRTLSTNVAPIADGDGKQRGMLVTFDDVSETELMNQQLEEAVQKLESTQTELKRKNIELVRLATIDPLTGCLNRRALFEKMDSEFELAKRDGLDLSVVMADIDHFKLVNDNYGHAAGDAMIKIMADVLMEFCDANGCVGRYGGEEFCLVLVGADAEATSDLANRIRLAFREHTVLPDSPTGGKETTASFGVSTLKYGAVDVAALINQADEALYVSKDSGRNQVTIWADMNGMQREVG